MEFNHISVLLNESIEGLLIKHDGIYVDGTIGGGGHSLEICRRLSDKGRLIGIDRDSDALDAAREKLEGEKQKVTLVRGNYGEIDTILKDLGVPLVDGILLDLGVSSYQLDNPERGFSYKTDAPLDMRMDDRQTKTAFDVINKYGEEELYRVIKNYGEERFAGNIARNIVKKRAHGDIKSTGELCGIIKDSIPAKYRQSGGNPAKRTFQAVRIEVNDELSVLKESIDKMIMCLSQKGRMCVITFHSLEDRIVKTKFRENENPCTCPPDFPVCVCGKTSRGKVITKKPILPSKEEVAKNKRAKSAKLRIFERLTENE